MPKPEYDEWAARSGVTKAQHEHSFTNYLWHGNIGKAITKKQSELWPYQYSGYESARNSFSSLWESLYGQKEGCSWADNPWVWVYTFERVDKEGNNG